MPNSTTFNCCRYWNMGTGRVRTCVCLRRPFFCALAKHRERRTEWQRIDRALANAKHTKRQENGATRCAVCTTHVYDSHLHLRTTSTSARARHIHKKDVWIYIADVARPTHTVFSPIHFLYTFLCPFPFYLNRISGCCVAYHFSVLFRE